MDKFLSGPSTVLVVGTGPAESAATAVDRHDFPPAVTRAELRDAGAVDHDPTLTVETVADADTALTALEAAETVGCVVVDDGLADPVGFVGTVVERRPDLPVVVVAAAGDEGLAETVTRAGAYAYLTWGDDDGAGEDHYGTDSAEADAERGDAPDGTDASGDRHAALVETVERALRDHDRRYRNAQESEILDTMLRDLGVAMYAKDDRARHVKMADVPGGPNPPEALGKTDSELYGEDNVAADALADDMAVIEDGEVVRDRNEQWGAGEAASWFRTTKVPWRGPDREVKGLVGITQNVTDLEWRIRELESANERLEEFASYVTHDLRNPLNVATGYLELARERDDADLDRVVSALDRMDEILADLGAVARGDDSVESRTERVELGPLAEAVWQGIAPWTATLEVDAPAETTLLASESRLHPLLENLFKNALDHVGPEVSVRVGLTADGFYVEDDGPGIPEHRREDVLEEGFTTGDGGTGTGLAIVADVADAHDWDLDVTEGSDGGARVEFGNVLLAADPAPAAWDDGTATSLESATDVGDPTHAGESSYDADGECWTVESAGRDLWRETNEFHFVHVPVEGAVRVEARVTALDGASEWSKAGLMVRDSLSEDATHGHVGVTSGGLTEVLWRREPGGETRSQQVDLDGSWLRLDRVGDTVTCFVSADGTEWQAVDQRPVSLGAAVYVGLVVCSAMYGEYATATFADVTVLEEPAE